MQKQLSKILIVLGTIFLFATLAFIYGFLIEPGLLRPNYQTSSNWPSKPLTVVFFSDLHMGAPHITGDYVDDLVNRINQSKPDIVLIGGDLLINGVIGGHHVDIQEVISRLVKLNSKLGTFAVLGNHDWWNDGDNIVKKLQEAGIKVLENQSQKINQDPGAVFQLVGIGDRLTGHTDLEAAFSNVDSHIPSIVFMHDPGSLLELKKKFNLAFAGHMHGGQVFVPGIGALVNSSMAPKSWAKGWVDLPIGKLFVSVGVGTSILPIRINAIPEFVVLKLNSSSPK